MSLSESVICKKLDKDGLRSCGDTCSAKASVFEY
jgi:hypothetical protein